MKTLLRVAVCEDNLGDAARLRWIIKRANVGAEVSELAFFASGEKFLDSNPVGCYDVVFMDIYFTSDAKLTGLEAEMGFMSMILDERRGQYARLMESSRRDATARHDFRHQIATIRNYCERGDMAGLNSFLGKVAESLPSSPVPICENFAVNAVADHYFSMARENGISLNVRLNIPQSVGRVHDLDLCVMAGNLLENAVEACRRQKAGPRFINVVAQTRDDTLTMVVENGFDGLWQKRAGAYLSRKRQAEEPQPGVGISSVREICRKYDGLLKFDVSENVWRASVLFDLTGTSKELTCNSRSNYYQQEKLWREFQPPFVACLDFSMTHVPARIYATVILTEGRGFTERAPPHVPFLPPLSWVARR
ncbi:MAG: GHKL domain-containing protein [Synergistaceae bacterium]|nr:GHKL domain-containing protein [Synergistaceae bacterium]